MKLTASFSRIIAAFVALGIAAVFTAAQADTGKVEVKGVSGGKASYSTDGKTFKPLKVGTRLSEKAVVRTEDGAHVDMKVTQGGNTSVIRADQKSQLGFDKLQFEETGADTVVENKFNLPEGEVFGNVAKIAAASKYEIATPNGVAGIRGTQYRVASSGAVSVISGRVSMVISRTVSTPQGAQMVTVAVQVEAGQTFTPPPLTPEGTAILVQMAAAQAQVQVAQAAVAAAVASGNAQAQQAAQAQLATAQAAVQTTQAQAITATPATFTAIMVNQIADIAVVTGVGITTPTGGTPPAVVTEVVVVVPEPEPVITVTTP